MTEDITLRLARPDELEFLFHVLKMSLGPYIEQTHGSWQEDEQRARFFELTKPETHQIVERAGQPIGCLSVTWVPGEVKLNRVFLLPPFQGRGIGSRLVRQVLADAEAAGLPVRLRVLKVNPAQRLYERLGFVVTGQTDTHFLMERAAHPRIAAGLMDEYRLPAQEWPAMPALHRAFLVQALPTLRADPRLEGVAAGGSFVTGWMDEHSDLDLVVVAVPEHSQAVLDAGAHLARALGPLLAAFPGDHLGELRLLICLYGPPLLHVDFKFVSTEELTPRTEESRVLWDRRGRVRAGLATGKAVEPPPRYQWMEDRFWTWVHYIAVKIARGELFAAIDGLALMRARVLGPLILAAADVPPHGVRRIEARAPRDAERLRDTVAAHDASSCRAALQASIAFYTELRERVAPPTLVRRSDAERAARDFLARTNIG